MFIVLNYRLGSRNLIPGNKYRYLLDVMSSSFRFRPSTSFFDFDSGISLFALRVLPCRDRVCRLNTAEPLGAGMDSGNVFKGLFYGGFASCVAETSEMREGCWHRVKHVLPGCVWACGRVAGAWALLASQGRSVGGLGESYCIWSCSVVAEVLANRARSLERAVCAAK